MPHQPPRTADEFLIRRALELLQDPDTDASRLARLIDGDPVVAQWLATTARRLVDRPVPVRSTREAITWLGFPRVEAALRCCVYGAPVRDGRWRRGLRYARV